MKWRVFFFVSLAVNVLLAVFWVATVRRHAAEEAADDTEVPAAPGRTNTIVRRQFFTWSQVESDDYPTYIANLRDIACPEQTIRDIIIADVNGLYARRLATEVITPEQQWWRSEPDPAVVAVASARARTINDERRALLARLLGPNWETGDLINLPRPSRPGIVLDGPVLGLLPVETKQAIEDVSVRAQERLQAYLEAQRQQGKEPDARELAKLRQQTREELSHLLTPSQVEEYLLRYSQNANNLRTELGRLNYFEATADEFRAIFRATDTIDQQLELLADSTDANASLTRNSLLQQRDNAIKLALGPDRYEQFMLMHDPAYQNAYLAAQQAGTPGAVDTLYEINLATAQAQSTIRSNTILTPEQKAIELKRLELEQLRANAEAMGQTVLPDAPPAQTATPLRTHVIQPGDTIGMLSLQFSVPMSAIRAANSDIDLSHIKPGDTIRIPQSVPPSPSIMPPASR